MWGIPIRGRAWPHALGSCWLDLVFLWALYVAVGAGCALSPAPVGGELHANGADLSAGTPAALAERLEAWVKDALAELFPPGTQTLRLGLTTVTGPSDPARWPPARTRSDDPLFLPNPSSGTGAGERPAGDAKPLGSRDAAALLSELSAAWRGKGRAYRFVGCQFVGITQAGTRDEVDSEDSDQCPAYFARYRSRARFEHVLKFLVVQTAAGPVQRIAVSPYELGLPGTERVALFDAVPAVHASAQLLGLMTLYAPGEAPVWVSQARVSTGDWSGDAAGDATAAAFADQLQRYFGLAHAPHNIAEASRLYQRRHRARTAMFAATAGLSIVSLATLPAATGALAAASSAQATWLTLVQAMALSARLPLALGAFTDFEAWVMTRPDVEQWRWRVAAWVLRAASFGRFAEYIAHPERALALVDRARALLMAAASQG